MLKETRGGLAYGLYAFDDGGRPAGFLHASADVGSSGGSALALDTWSHLAATYDGRTLRVFVDGDQVGQRSLTGAMATSSSPR